MGVRVLLGDEAFEVIVDNGLVSGSGLINGNTTLA